MSLEEILERCDISVKVFVRSTRESRPSSAESKRMERCDTGKAGLAPVVMLEADSIEGMWGARNERAGC